MVGNSPQSWATHKKSPNPQTKQHKNRNKSNKIINTIKNNALANLYKTLQKWPRICDHTLKVKIHKTKDRKSQ